MFNLAMLTKQAWNMLTRPMSLCAKVLKGLYIFYCDVMNAKCFYIGSWAWKSLYKGLEVQKSNCIWCIGDGFRVIFGMMFGFVHSNSLAEYKVDEFRMVSDLINQEEHC